MAVRVTATEVKSIIDTSLADSVVDVYIGSANAMVNDVLGTGTTSILKEIERWLTAHMISLTRERMAAKEGAGGAEIEYVGKTGEGLSSTPYGQMVLELDDTGAMAALGRKKAFIRAVTSFD